MKIIRMLLIALLVVLVLIQFIRPAKNEKGSNQYAVYTGYRMSQEVSAILKPACLDCHSNTTQYPWYANVQPAAWWLANHVKEGKRHLNFSEFVNRSIAYQYHKFEEIAELVREKEMPLPSYTWFGLHPEADLTDEQREIIATWAEAQMAVIASSHPADSLVMKRK